VHLDSVMISISWFCDFHANPVTSCPYCWVTMAEPNRSRALDRPAESWLEGIRQHIPATAVLDFVGGEPTVFPRFYWLVEQLSVTYRWALTSNMGGQRWRLYKEQPMSNCVSWTASYHHTSRDAIGEFADKCLEMAPHYPISVNIVDHPSHDAQAAATRLREQGLKAYVSPFEDVRDLNVPGPLPLSCNGGHAHITIDPQVFAYQCLTQQRRADRERWRLGNIFDGGIAWPAKRSICFLPCDQFYTLDRKHATRDMWGLDVREIAVPDSLDLEPYRAQFGAPPSPRRNFIQLSQWAEPLKAAGQDSPLSEPGGARDSGSEAEVTCGEPNEARL